MPQKRYYHNPVLPKGWANAECIDNLRCQKCHAKVTAHRVAHIPQGEDWNCTKCGVPRHMHVAPPDDYLVGIDGEGESRPFKPGYEQFDKDGKPLENHVYTMLAYSDAVGRNVAHIRDPEGLSTKQCLDFILSIPNRARPFAFAFNYDLTMILRDLDDCSLYLLFRPELRSVKGKSKPVKWEGYELQLVGTKFSVKRGHKRITIWDTFRFYQCSFVDALETWKVAQPKDLIRMRKMKLARGSFEKYDDSEVLEYCLEECRYMAVLTDKLITSHKTAGLPLRSFFGAGSTASVLLKQIGIHKAVRSYPDALKGQLDIPVASAFFGGRFENRIVGAVPGMVHSYDISSAYPYQLYQLPCLECGCWEHVTEERAAKGAQAVLVRYSLNPRNPDKHWGPLPVRLDDGCIVFPSRSGGGWVWGNEYAAAKRHWSGLKFREAWTYRTDCTHRPFERIADIYVQRLKIGKEGPGIVYKLGANSCYGKLAQSVGMSRPFRSMVWAGLVTAGTRAQLLDAIGSHKNRANCLMLATDGIYTREELDMPKPSETGTGDIGVLNPKTNELEYKPLGGWEHKEVPNGIFAARPGIYFPLKATKEEEKQFRARGIGRKALYESFQKIIDAHDNNLASVRVASTIRFHGAKSSIHIGRDEETDKPCFVRSERYGQWRPRPIDMSFSPAPKRATELKDGTLTLVELPLDLESVPYDRALVSPDAMTLKIAEAIALEQPQ